MPPLKCCHNNKLDNRIVIINVFHILKRKKSCLVIMFFCFKCITKLPELFIISVVNLYFFTCTIEPMNKNTFEIRCFSTFSFAFKFLPLDFVGEFLLYISLFNHLYASLYPNIFANSARNLNAFF